MTSHWLLSYSSRGCRTLRVLQLWSFRVGMLEMRRHRLRHNSKPLMSSTYAFKVEATRVVTVSVSYEIYIVITHSDMVAMNRRYCIHMDRIIRPGCESQSYLIWVKGWCIWLLRCRTVGTKTSETFQLSEIIINFCCGGTWLMSGKRTLGLGHMSRKTPEVKIGLYSPLSQLTGCLKPREGICHIVGRV